MKANRVWGLVTASVLAVMLAACGPAATPAPPTEAVAPPTATSVPPTATLYPTSSPTEAPPTPEPTPAFAPVERSEPDAPLDRWAQGARLGRGVNLGNALEAPVEGEWGMVIEANYFAAIREAGFDTVRVPIRWSAHAESEWPFTVDEVFFRRVDWVIDQATAQGLNVAINMHHYNPLFSNPDDHEWRFLSIWYQIAVRYRFRPDNLYYEPLNEPHDKLTANRWNRLLGEVVEVIRAVDGVHTLVIGTAEWGGIGALPKLKLPEGEENLVCTVHFYAPMLFTHQGAEWSGDEYQTLGVIWPGPPETPLEPVEAALNQTWTATWFEGYNTQPAEINPGGPQPMVADFDWAQKQSERFDCPIWLGEFGAYDKADMASRVRWTTFVREEAESRGWSWAYWEFGAGFGVYDRTAGHYREELLAALIPEE